MGRPPINEHGTRAMYAKGCKCLGCRQAAAEYSRRYRAGLGPRPLTAVADDSAASSESVEPGRLAAAVAAEIEGLPAEKRKSALAALALSLADDIGRVEFGSSHAGLAKELRTVLTELHAGPVTQGRLAVVAGISHRPRSPAG
jgi:hypothetical protein